MFNSSAPDVPVPKRSAGIVAAVILAGLLFVAPRASAQAVPVINVSLKAVPSSDGTLEWRFTKLPSESDILTSDPLVRPSLLRNLQFIQSHNSKGTYNALGQFQDTMLRGVPSDFDWYGPKDPSALQDSPPPQLLATFVPSAPRATPTLKIVVRVSGSALIDAHPVATTIGALQSHKVAGLSALTAEDQKTVVLVTGGQGAGAPPVSWMASAEHAIAYDCAAQAFNSAKRHHLQQQTPSEVGSDLPSDLVQSEVAGYILSQVNPLARPSPPGMDVNTELPAPGNTWVVTVPLVAVGNVTFQIASFHAGVDLPWDQFKKTNWYAAAPAGFDADKQKVEARMTRQLHDVFARLQHTLVTNAQYQSDRDHILAIVDRKSPTGPPSIIGTGVNDIVVQAALIPTDTTLSLGGGYSSDKHVFGSVSATVVGKGMSGSLTAEAGGKKQDGTLSFSLPSYFHSDDHKWNASLDITGNFTHAADLELNQPDNPGTKLDSATAELLNHLKYLTSRGSGTGLAPGDSSYQSAVETAAGYNDVTWKQPAAATRPLEGGGVLYLRLGLNQEWTRTFAKADASGLGSIDVIFDVNLKQGIDAGPGKFGFTSIGANMMATFYFGRVTSTDYFCRVILGGGTMAGNAPVTEEFELGGNKVIHGLDQDERTARGVAWQSLTLGASLESLLRLLPSSPASSTATPSGGPPAAGQSPLKSIYLAGFAEFAEITQASVSQSQHLASSLQSFGGALEMHLNTGGATNGRIGTTQIRCGYAWSPESTHRSGLFFTDVAIPIF